MALISCGECGREVSERAPACPQCGAPVAPASSERVRTSEDSALTRSRGCGDLLLFVVVLPVLAALIWLATR